MRDLSNTFLAVAIVGLGLLGSISSLFGFEELRGLAWRTGSSPSFQPFVNRDGFETFTGEASVFVTLSDGRRWYPFTEGPGPVPENIALVALFSVLDEGRFKEDSKLDDRLHYLFCTSQQKLFFPHIPLPVVGVTFERVSFLEVGERIPVSIHTKVLCEI